METNEFKRRILILKKTTSLNSFAAKCGVPYSTMRGYIEDDSQPTLENAKKIAAACNVSVGWLAGEIDDEWTRTKNRGLTLDRHFEVGEELKQISYKLSRLWHEFGHAYPEEGDMGRATAALGRADKAVAEARHFAEENMFIEHKNDPRCTFAVYYGKDIERQKREDEAQRRDANSA